MEIIINLHTITIVTKKTLQYEEGKRGGSEHELKSKQNCF